ncbi:hypothetical protein CHS0354_015927 [Potamilus streckersoni]|uniref:Uncharacterized protein n=1 Tax=Potamilus streckersoni TaxID=2493646 RepID=A0AAE0SRN3_9BIVA|nr:hypothetical protein CHS0354_015927 [Potamilus streckersoni]
MSRKLERELRLSNFTSRRAWMEREKAMEAARNPGFSKFGECLVNSHSKQDKLLNSRLNRINTEIRKMEKVRNQEKKHFVKCSGVLNHDPLILVERLPSPSVIKRAMTLMINEDIEGIEDDSKVPGYMRPLRSRTRTPSTLMTIDAFVLKSKKKRNVWEEAMNDKEPLVFQSMARPYTKLTERDKSDLQLGYSVHKPKLTPNTVLTESEDGKKNKSHASKKKMKQAKRKPTETDSESSSDSDDLTPFITQMASVRKKKRDKKERISADSIQEALIDKKPVRFASPVPLFPKVHRRKLKTKETQIVHKTQIVY